MTSDPLLLSYSRSKTYRQCGEQYRLKYIEQLSDIPGWYNVGGSAFHAQVHDLAMADHGMPPADGREKWSFRDYFYEEEEAQADASPGIPKSEWKTAGRKTKADPIGEGRTWWLSEGQAMVNRWKNWYRDVPMDIWITDDGEPALEIQFDYEIEPGTRIRGAIDSVWVHRQTGHLVIVDYKTGKPPKDQAQLGTYGNALVHQYGDLGPLFGGYWMARGGVLTGMYGLDVDMGPKLVYGYLQDAKGIKAEAYPPSPSKLCDWCSFQSFCSWGGKLTDKTYLPYEEG